MKKSDMAFAISLFSVSVISVVFYEIRPVSVCVRTMIGGMVAIDSNVLMETRLTDSSES